MSLQNNIIVPHKEIKTVADVTELIEREIDATTEEIGKLAFKSSPDDDKQRTRLIAKRDVLISLLSAIK